MQKGYLKNSHTNVVTTAKKLLLVSGVIQDTPKINTVWWHMPIIQNLGGTNREVRDLKPLSTTEQQNQTAPVSSAYNMQTL